MESVNFLNVNYDVIRQEPSEILDISETYTVFKHPF